MPCIPSSVGGTSPFLQLPSRFRYTNQLENLKLTPGPAQGAQVIKSSWIIFQTNSIHSSLLRLHIYLLTRISQLERHTATLKRAERVIKHAALRPSLDAFHEPLLSRSQSGLSHDPHLSAFSTTNLRSSFNSQRRSPSPNGFVSFPASASATHQPYTFHDHMDRPRSRATSPAPSVYHYDHHHADRPDSRASSPTPTGHYHHQQIHHNSTQRQLSNDGEFDNFQNGFSEASSPRASSAAPLDRSRLSSTGSDLVVPEQRRRKEFQELEDALIQEGRSKGFADVNLYTEKKVVGKKETCWEYRHVHFDFNKSQTGSEGHHDEVESKAAAPSHFMAPRARMMVFKIPLR